MGKQHYGIKVSIVLRVVKTVATQIIIKPIHPSEMVVIYRFVCFFVSYNGPKRRNKVFGKKMTSLSIKSTVFLSGSPLSNEISKRRGDARENAVHKKHNVQQNFFGGLTLYFYLLLNGCALYFSFLYIVFVNKFVKSNVYYYSCQLK